MKLVVCSERSWPLFEKSYKNASLMPDRRIIPRQDAGNMDNGWIDVINLDILNCNPIRQE